jgi:hypothetical protein
MTGRPDPPSGHPPPERATTPAGELDLVALAAEACERYDAEYPDERDRYGDAGMAWCRHDNQHVLNWAVSDVHAGHLSLLDQVAWLARVLEARDFPLDRLARNLEIDGDVVTERTGDAPLAGRLRDAAAFVRERGTFLSEAG